MLSEELSGAELQRDEIQAMDARSPS